MLLFKCYVMSDSFATLWTVARQAPLSVGLSRQEYWSCHALFQGISGDPNQPPSSTLPQETAVPVEEIQSTASGQKAVRLSQRPHAVGGRGRGEARGPGLERHTPWGGGVRFRGASRAVREGWVHEKGVAP